MNTNNNTSLIYRTPDATCIFFHKTKHTPRLLRSRAVTVSVIRLFIRLVILQGHFDALATGRLWSNIRTRLPLLFSWFSISINYSLSRSRTIQPELYCTLIPRTILKYQDFSSPHPQLPSLPTCVSFHNSSPQTKMITGPLVEMLSRNKFVKAQLKWFFQA